MTFHLQAFVYNFNFEINNSIVGSFADREHRKWSQSAVSMPNNPYTTESVMTRKYSRNLGAFTPNNG